MTVTKIVELLNLPHNKNIHKIYSTIAGYCYITSRDGTRYKLDYTLSEKEVNRMIELVRWDSNKTKLSFLKRPESAYSNANYSN